MMILILCDIQLLNNSMFWLTEQYDYNSHSIDVLLHNQASTMRTGEGNRDEKGGRGIIIEGGQDEMEERNVLKRKSIEEPDEDCLPTTIKVMSGQRCDVCGEQASGHYFGALVCLPCKVSLSQGAQIWPHIGSKWHQMGQISYLFKISFLIGVYTVN